MITTFAIGVWMIAQAGSSMVLPGEQSVEIKDVAYEELAVGNVSAALAELEAQRLITPNEPALLINLGAAYAMQGDYVRAQECYEQAMASSVRYDVELADGSWADSRLTARVALSRLERGTLALR